MTRSAKILMCWELGGGAGHLSNLRRLAEAIVSRGHQPVLAIPIGCSRSLLDSAFDLEVVEIPSVESLIPMQTFKARSFTDILGASGFASVEFLYQRTKLWRDIVRQLQPDVVLSEFSPFANFASKGVAPTLGVGTGYSNPPIQPTDFAVLNPAVAPTYALNDLDENALQVAERLGFADALDFSAKLPNWTGSDQARTRCFRFVDPYQRTRSESVSGPVHVLQINVDSHLARQRRFFAYFWGSHPVIDTIVEGLCQARVPGDVYIEQPSMKTREFIAEAGLNLLDQPPPLATMLSRAALVVHHSGIGTAQACAQVGVPQLVVPMYLEHELTGLALLRAGVAAALVPPFTASDVAYGIQRVLDEPSYSASAIRLSEELAQAGPYRFIDEVLETIETML